MNRMRMMSLVAPLAAAALLTSACGGDEQASASPTTVEVVTEEPVAEPTPEPVDATPTVAVGALDLRGQWSLRNEAGYSYDLTIDLGKPVKPTALVAHPDKPDFTAGSACSADPETDAVIAGRLLAKSTTPDFSVTLRASTTLVSAGEYTGTGIAPANDDERFDFESDYSSGPDCSYASSFSNGYNEGKMSVKWDDEVGEGTSKNQEFFIIVHNYYTPAAPDGDAALLDAVALQPLPAGAPDAPAEMYQLDEAGTFGANTATVMTLSGRQIPRE